MRSTPDPEAPRASSLRGWMLFPALMLALPLGFLYGHHANAPIRAEAAAFLDDLRHNREAAATARMTEALRVDYARGVSHHDNTTAHDTPAVVSETLRRSTGVSLGGDSYGIDRRCFEGSLDGVTAPNTVYIEMVRENGVWRVDGVSVRRGFGLCHDD